MGIRKDDRIKDREELVDILGSVLMPQIILGGMLAYTHSVQVDIVEQKIEDGNFA